MKKYKRSEQRRLRWLYGLSGLLVAVLVLASWLVIYLPALKPALMVTAILLVLCGATATFYNWYLFLKYRVQGWMVGILSSLLIATATFIASQLAQSSINDVTGYAPQYFENALLLTKVIMLPKSILLLFGALAVINFCLVLILGLLLALRNTIASAIEHSAFIYRRVPQWLSARTPTISEWNFGGRVVGSISVVVFSLMVIVALRDYQYLERSMIRSLVEELDFYSTRQCKLLPLKSKVAFLSASELLVLDVNAEGVSRYTPVYCPVVGN